MKTIELITIFAMITTLMVTVVAGDPIDPKVLESLVGK
uniref:U12-myrmicitoxin-Mri1a n=1 Tax=Manica rubida TaxID=219785 RepID=TX12A_MANRB|nr:RecName: Full=U12-myrmicitoxin-Mri1a; Short=U12-MYRTX-Mri1a; AltName: Full=U-MYRTX-MANr1; Flags: Precursor [Manica rubida]QIQ51447.1 U12-MYRTX-Mri1a precursor [Manica rubida]